VSGRMERPGHVVVFAENTCRHVCSTQANGGELESPARIFLQGDAAGRDALDGTGDIIDRGSEVPVVHLDD
jgi:hypothetical protein